MKKIKIVALILAFTTYGFSNTPCNTSLGSAKEKYYFSNELESNENIKNHSADQIFPNLACKFKIKTTFDGVKVDLEVEVDGISWLECLAIKAAIKAYEATH
jgi:hypothetical protein